MVATIIILIVVAGITAMCVWKIIKDHKNGCSDCGGSCGSSCGGNCSGCHQCDAGIQQNKK